LLNNSSIGVQLAAFRRYPHQPFRFSRLSSATRSCFFSPVFPVRAYSAYGLSASCKTKRFGVLLCGAADKRGFYFWGKKVKMMEEKTPLLDQIVHIIVSKVAPDKIILFGSYARGDHKKDSDIDLLILKKGLKNERNVINALYIEFFNNKIATPVDLIALNYDTYNSLNAANDIGYIYKTIEQEGKILFG
jgi:predicted nucleotidyltransferase